MFNVERSERKLPRRSPRFERPIEKAQCRRGFLYVEVRAMGRQTYVAFSDEKQAFAMEKYLKSPSGRAFAKKRL